jgi:hypothetical protein
VSVVGDDEPDVGSLAVKTGASVEVYAAFWIGRIFQKGEEWSSALD